MEIIKGDSVNLPFGAKGIVKSYRDLLWGSRFYVKITDSPFVEDIGTTKDFFPNQVELADKFEKNSR